MTARRAKIKTCRYCDEPTPATATVRASGGRFVYRAPGLVACGPNPPFLAHVCDEHTDQALHECRRYPSHSVTAIGGDPTLF